MQQSLVIDQADLGQACLHLLAQQFHGLFSTGNGLELLRQYVQEKPERYFQAIRAYIALNRCNLAWAKFRAHSDNKTAKTLNTNEHPVADHALSGPIRTQQRPVHNQAQADSQPMPLDDRAPAQPPLHQQTAVNGQNEHKPGADPAGTRLILEVGVGTKYLPPEAPPKLFSTAPGYREAILSPDRLASISGHRLSAPWLRDGDYPARGIGIKRPPGPHLGQSTLPSNATEAERQCLALCEYIMPIPLK